MRVAVIGGGNAALCAAISASECGCDVYVFERAPFEMRGGNSRFTAGAMRTVYDGVWDLKKLIPDLTKAEIDRTDFGSYTRDQFFDDLGRLTHYRSDPDLSETLIDQSFSTLLWMHENGVRFLPLYGRQSFNVDGKQRFWGGLTVEAWGGGEGLIDILTSIARQKDVQIRYDARVSELSLRDGGFEFDVWGEQVSFDRVILACGGFESSAEWRTRYLGPNWDLARVRGTRYNTGDGLRMAMNLGAEACGNWSGCHAVAWDLNAPDYGDLDVGDNFQKHSYPLGILVNNEGKRFLDEGADFRNFTYAKYGREILAQTNQTAWQIFDQKVAPLLRDEYRIKQVTRYSASSLKELASRMGVHGNSFLETAETFNHAVNQDIPFNPAIKDGRGTVGLEVPKSNWAQALDKPPFEAYGVTCGITFTFGGIRINEKAQVLDQSGSPIPGLYAAGELVGGLFYFNYPGGSGLTSGAVFGKIAGREAARPTN